MRYFQLLFIATVVQLVSASSTLAHLKCGQYPFDGNVELAEIHASLSAAIAPFPRLSETLNSDLTICLSDTLVSARGYYEPDDRMVVLADDMPSGLLLAVAVHELRHVQQFDVGSCPSLDLSMHEYANGVFAMEADASVTSLVVAAFLREQGDPTMWDALASWPMQSDLAERFDAELEETSSISLAASAAFSAWYKSEERMDSYYISVCSNYLDQIDREHALPRYDSLSDGYFLDLCRLPDGTFYECRSPS